MTRKDFAALVGVSASRASQWATEGWLVLDEEGQIIPEPSIEKLKKRMPYGINAPRSVRSKQSHWSRGPHCESTNAFNSWSKLKSIAK